MKSVRSSPSNERNVMPYAAKPRIATAVRSWTILRPRTTLGTSRICSLEDIVVWAWAWSCRDEKKASPRVYTWCYGEEWEKGATRTIYRTQTQWLKVGDKE